MDGINGNTPVNRSTKIMGYDTAKAVNITHMVKKLDASQVNMDTFVKYEPKYYGMKMNVTPSALARKAESVVGEASRAVMAKADELVKGYYDGEISSQQLQTKYEALAKEYVGVLEEDGYSSTQVKYCAAEAFHDAFKVKLLEEAVQRNNAEGRQYVSEGFNSEERAYHYYNADYYHQSEVAISAITDGAKNVAESYGIEYGSLNTAQGLSVEGDDRYYNFNTAWSYSSRIGSKFMADTGKAPPENFKWFYEVPKGGVVTSVTYEEADGRKVTEYYHQANAWASWGEGAETQSQYHRVDADFPYGFKGKEDDPLETFAELLKFSTGNPEVDAILNGFLENLWIDPTEHYNRFMFGTGGINIQA